MNLVVFHTKESRSCEEQKSCTTCGKVVEFKDEVIEERQRKMAEAHGFSLTDHSLYLYGMCADCLAAARHK